MRYAKVGAVLAVAALFLTVPAISQELAVSGKAEDLYRFMPGKGGDDIETLVEIIEKETDVAIVLDPNSPQVRGRKITVKGVVTIPRKKIFHWMQSLFSFHRLIFVPVGPKEGNVYALHDMNSPQITTRPIHVPEAEIEKWADRDGVYIVTTVSLKHLSDTSRARNALAQLSTRQIGRINDIPQSRSFVIGDFAPVVYAQWKLLKEMDLVAATAPPLPQAVRGAVRGAKAVAAPKSEGQQAIERYEQLLSTSVTANAAQYFLAQIAIVRAQLLTEQGQSGK